MKRNKRFAKWSVLFLLGMAVSAVPMAAATLSFGGVGPAIQVRAEGAIDLSTLTEGCTLTNGQTVKGTLVGAYKLSIADKATVTFSNVTINCSSEWAGLTLLGDATLVFEGTNVITMDSSAEGGAQFPCIYVPSGKTVTISGEGALNAIVVNGTTKGAAAAIGGGHNLSSGHILIKSGMITAKGGAGCPGIGSGIKTEETAVTGGNIVIDGGSVNATGGVGAPGIGAGQASKCGNIEVRYGSVTAKGGAGAPGIGSGNAATCGAITFATSLPNVTSIKGTGAANSIGAGEGGTCGKINLGGDLYNQSEIPCPSKTPFIYLGAEHITTYLAPEINPTLTKNQLYYANVGAAFTKDSNYTKPMFYTATIYDLDGRTVLPISYPTNSSVPLNLDFDFLLTAKNTASNVRTLTLRKCYICDYTALPTAKQGLYYDGEEQELVNGKDIRVTNGELQFQLGQNASTAPTGEWTTSIPKGKKGMYYVWYRIMPKAEYHAGLAPRCLTVKVTFASEEIEALPNPENVTVAHKAAIEAARAAYEALPENEKPALDPALLQKLIADEAALSQALIDDATNKINNLPDPTSITKSNKAAIEAARAAYDLLTDAQKSEVGTGVLNKLLAAESALDMVYVDEVTTKINNIKDPSLITKTDKAEINAARAAYEALTEEQKALVDAAVLAKLVAAEEALSTAFVNEAALLINNLPDADSITLSDKSAVTAARSSYNGLSDVEKAKIDADTLAKLLAAESAIRVLTCEDTINKLPAAESVTLSNKAAIEAARAAYDALSDEEKGKVDQTLVDKLVAVEGKLSELKVADATKKINALPDPVTLSNKNAIQAARNAYDVLSEEEKANVDAEVLAKLLAAESTIKVIECSNLITALPDAESVKKSDEAAILVAKEAFDALSDEEKANIDAELVEKLNAAVAALSASKIADATAKISSLPSEDEISPSHKSVIEAARAAYEALYDEDKAAFSPELLAKLVAAEFALTRSTIAYELDKLPESLDDITTANKTGIENARAVYDSLPDEEKAKVDPELVTKLEQAEIALAKAIVTENIGSLPENPEDITLADKEAIQSARAAYDALPDEEKAKIDPTLVAKLEASEIVLNKLIVEDTVSKLPENPEDITLADKEAIEEAIAAYDALPDKEKAKIDPSVVAKLEAAESALEVLEASKTIEDLPSADQITLDDKEEIIAAREAYEALSDEEKAKVNPGLVEKLEAAESALEVLEASKTIEDLPSADQITLADKEEIIAAREAYEALSDEEKAKVNPGLVGKLEAAESALEVLEASKTIEDLPSADQITIDDKDKVMAAKEAYDALSEEEKAKVSPEDKQKLDDAVNTIVAIEVSDVISALPEAGEVTLADKVAIEAARSAYDALTDKQKAKVDPKIYSRLVNAENGLVASEVKGLIDAIGEVDGSEGSKAKIDAARTAYDKLTEEQKALVGAEKLAKLTEAESTYAQLTSGLPGGMIAGIVILSILTLGAAGLLIFLILRLRKTNKDDNGGQAVVKSSVLFVPFLAILSAAGGATAAIIVLSVVLAGLIAADVVVFLKLRKKGESARLAKKAAEEKARQEEEAKKAEEAKKQAEEEAARKAEEAEAEKKAKAEKAAEEVHNAEEEAKEKEPLSLRQAMALAKEKKDHKSLIGKAFCASYLKDKHGDNVEINRRENETSTGLPLADTHYVVDGKKKKCFVYVYETEGTSLLLINANEEIASDIKKRHADVRPSAFPKSKDSWYAVLLDESYSEEEVIYILDRCVALALGREEALSLKESLALAKSAKGKHTFTKQAVCDYLGKYGDEVELNTRGNFTKTGLPLADTHYVVDGKKKKCFVYVYETGGAMMLLIKATPEFVEKLKADHPAVHDSAFPKSKDTWASVVLDESYDNDDVKKLLDDLVEINK